ncbi:ABC transporter ATP-binding protein [Lacibacterium aquatile]|uniref:ABC transporter ATP-binding protein n=1 Tax=Lacibacterium aquatile TaxID=1168082 RepID=A0ABW5DM38_9PROT
MNAPLLDIRGLGIQFAGATNPAVQGLDLQISAGETLAIVGESGSGKSVTALAALALLPPTASIEGAITLAGVNMRDAPDSERRKVRGTKAAIIFQEPMTALNPLHTVEQQIGETLTLKYRLTGAALKARIIELLTEVGIDNPETRLPSYPHQLSGGQRQRVMIAAALAGDPDLLIADEPTTAIDVTLQVQILALLKTLQARRGMGLLLITHDLSVVRRMADRVIVMQRGQMVEQGATDAILSNPQHAYTRGLIDAEPNGEPAPLAPDAVTLVEAKEVKVWFPIKAGVLRRTVGHVKGVDGVSLTLKAGETLGVVGESGSGKSSLGYALVGLLAAGGSIQMAGADLGKLSGRALRPHRRNFQIVFQDPFGALNPRLTVGDLIGEGLDLHKLEPTQEGRDARIVAALREVDLDPELRHRYPHEFSGGQRQRIAIARALILQPKVIVLDEPTSALDRTVQAQVIDLLRDLQRRHGIAYIFISHDLAVVRAMSHRILVMRHGRIVEEGPAAKVFDAPEADYTRELVTAARA